MPQLPAAPGSDFPLLAPASGVVGGESVIWIIIVLIWELVVLIQLMMSCQQQAHGLLIAQNLTEQRMDKHRDTLRELASECDR